jgi:membrane dipeptidase
MVEMAGEDHVGLGSDFDGAPMPEGLHSAAELQTLVAAMREAGFGEALIRGICEDNWMGFLRRRLPAGDVPVTMEEGRT